MPRTKTKRKEQAIDPAPPPFDDETEADEDVQQRTEDAEDS